MSLTKAELLDRIDHAWADLERLIQPLSDAQLAAPGPEGDWAIKDHLVHLMAWENSMVYLLNHRPRYLGLGVDEATYLTGDDDTINAAIQRNHASRAPAEVLAAWRETHRQMLDGLARLSDSDLLQTHSHFLPEEPGDKSGEPILNRIIGNTYEHYAEHHGYIQALITMLRA